LEVILEGEQLMIDVAIINPTNESNMKTAASKSLGAASHKEQEKTRFYERECAAIKAEFIPFIVETHGGIGNKAKQLIERLSTHMSKQHAPLMTTSEFTTDLYNAIACAVQRHNALIMQEGHVRSMKSLQERANRRRG
jgi:hypothetical protein